MKHPYAYQIIHRQLTDGVPLPVERKNQSGLYLIFWWQQTPVGHVFIEPDEAIAEIELKQKIDSVVQTTLEAYRLNKPAVATNDPIATQSVNPDSLKESLEIILGPYHVETFPESVPVTLIICTRNRPENLRSCLLTLQAMVCQPAEIIVVDNAPTDDSTERVVQQFENVTYCRELRPGLDIARNTGIRAARSSIIAYTDDDVAVHPLWIYQVWKTFTNTQVAAMTGLVIASELITEAQLIFETHWSFNRGYVDKYYDTNYYTKTLTAGPPVWEIGAGANMAFRRDIFNEVGYFDERLDVGAAGCSGDSEIWYRILAHGHTIQYNPRAVVCHTHRRELTALKKQLFNYMRGHIVAALIQHRQNPQTGYRRHVFFGIPRYYLLLLRMGFPTFPFRYRTLFVEMKGIMSGLLFYRKNRFHSPQKPA